MRNKQHLVLYWFSWFYEIMVASIAQHLTSLNRTPALANLIPSSAERSGKFFENNSIPKFYSLIAELFISFLVVVGKPQARCKYIQRTP
jgi:hypothetical protein